jgi:hypothetical protein
LYIVAPNSGGRGQRGHEVLGDTGQTGGPFHGDRSGAAAQLVGAVLEAF